MAETNEVEILSQMIGVVYDNVSVSDGNDELVLSSEGHRAKFHHRQNCCEAVSISQIDGDLLDLLGSPITMAEIVSRDASGEALSDSDGYTYTRDSATWTFLKLATAKGYVTVRWLGESNGWYSEDVNWVIDGIDDLGCEAY